MLRPELYQKCATYVDGIIVYCRTMDEHNASLIWVLKRCQQYDLKINSAKCQIDEVEVAFLGKVSHKGIAPSDEELT